jgi:hypothetical protein
MLDLIRVVVTMARHALTHEEHREEQKGRERESVVSQEALHRRPP